jgi:hypothetical protein
VSGLTGHKAKAKQICGHWSGFQVAVGLGNFMQNRVVTTSFNKSKPADRKPQSKPEHDFFLDPLPVPDASESNTDTAWGLWEHTLRSFEEEAQSPKVPDAADFADTVPSDLIPPAKKPS